MPYYDIAGLRVKMNNCGGRSEKQAVPYLADNQSDDLEPDINILVDDKRVQAAMAEHPELSQGDWEYMLTGSDFYTDLIKYDGILLHSSCVVVDGIAYTFSADSGTGKSTHTQLWLKKFGDRAYILNDDKPAIRLIGDTVYACGTPWSGKTPCYKNESLPLDGVVRLSQAPHNDIKRLPMLQAYASLMPACSCMRWDRNSTDALHKTVEKVITKVGCWHLECLPDNDAAIVCSSAVTK